MIYEIYKVEELRTKTNKPYKKMVLKGEGQQNTEERVTLWSDHPDFAGAVVGAKFDWNMLKEDSGVPIPAHPEKNYVNRSILMPNEVVQPAKPITANIAEMALKTHITQEIAPLKEALKAIVLHLDIKPPTPTVGTTSVPYPEMTEENSGEIDPEDIPF